jgi:large subunit ribosomal protein L6
MSVAIDRKAVEKSGSGEINASRIGKKPINLPANIKVTLEDQSIHLSNGKDSLVLAIHPAVRVVHEAQQLNVHLITQQQELKRFWGTTRALLANMVTGLDQGHQKKMIIFGVGYRATQAGANIQFALGYSHPVIFKVPAGIRITLPSQTEVVIAGADKQQVGQVAAEIRALRPPEAYKGKGVRYSDERIRCKEVKKNG